MEARKLWESDTQPFQLALRIRHPSMDRAEHEVGFVKRPSFSKELFRSGQSTAWSYLLDKTQSSRIAFDHERAMSCVGCL